MSIHRKDLDFIIKKTLTYLDPTIPYTDNAYELLRLTAAVESDYGSHLRQKGAGGARGVFQMEPITASWLINGYVAIHNNIKAKINGLAITANFFDKKNVWDELVGNLFLATAMARLKYWTVAEKLPDPINELAEYWKRYYNTSLGAGSVKTALKKYKKYCL